MTSIDRHRYAELFGPTTGDRIRLADTNLFIQVTEDRSMGAGSGDGTWTGGAKGNGKPKRVSPPQSTGAAPKAIGSYLSNDKVGRLFPVFLP